MPDIIKPENQVNAESTAYKRMAGRWQLIHDLNGGTQAMREAGERWLPRQEEENDTAYNRRLSQSFLYDAYPATIDRLAGKPFSKATQVKGIVPEPVGHLEKDADRAGTGLTRFLKRAFWIAANYGLVHCLTDMPQTPVGSRITLEEERRLQLRPFFTLIWPTQLVGWRTETDVTGIQRLTQIRIREMRTEPHGLYGDREVEWIRVIEPGRWELWRKDPDDKDERFSVEFEGAMSFGQGNEIPLRTLYFNQTGLLEGRPPFEALAWLNVMHWQSLSDQRNILNFARLVTLFMSGLTEKDVKQKHVLGPDRVIKTSSASAKAEFIEIRGPAMSAGQEDIDRIESRMEVMGLQPETRQTGNVTATGRAIDEARVTTDLESMIRMTESFAEECYTDAGRWQGLDAMPDEFAVDVYSEFSVAARKESGLDALLKIGSSLSLKTFLEECQRYGVLSDAIDIEDELERIEESAGSNLMSLMGEIPPADSEEESNEEEDAA